MKIKVIKWQNSIQQLVEKYWVKRNGERINDNYKIGEKKR